MADLVTPTISLGEVSDILQSSGEVNETVRNLREESKVLILSFHMIRLIVPCIVKQFLGYPSEHFLVEGCATETDACEGSDVDGKFCSLISLQLKETFYQVEGGLIALLRNCLASESQDTTSILSGYVDHFQSREWEDIGWGCGWRNIQMLSSHLITQRQEAREVLYGGAGFVPDIASLQRWLEIAWELGFDAQGSNDFDREIYGKRNWIGTTECAALFRSFGLRAMVVDFCSKGTPSASSTTALHHGKMASEEIVGKGKLTKVYGPMDRYLSRRDNSFTHEIFTMPEDCTHSCALLGRSKRTEALAKSLEQNCGWQKLIKRGIHTLKKPQYQLCFIEPGIASGEEIDQLKVLYGINIEV
nr:zinc finger-containing ubiquitin peptidase 1-like [Coffea arabica]